VVAQEEEELEELLLLLLLTAASQLVPLSTEPKNSVHCCYPRANTAAAPAWRAAGSNETKRGTSTTMMMQTNAQAMPMALTVCLSPCAFRAD
jgi:hypothetical protein